MSEITTTSHTARLTQHLSELATPKIIAVTDCSATSRVVDFEVLEKQGRIRLKVQPSSGINVIYGDPQSLTFLRAAEDIHRYVEAFIKTPKHLDGLRSIPIEEIAEHMIDKVAKRSPLGIEYFTANPGRPYNRLEAYGKMVVVQTATDENKRPKGSSIAHEMAHANGADEYQARKIEADYLKRNKLPSPSSEVILYTCLLGYHDRQGFPGEWMSWVSQWWNEKKGIFQKLIGIANLLSRASGFSRFKDD